MSKKLKISHVHKGIVFALTGLGMSLSTLAQAQMVDGALPLAQTLSNQSHCQFSGTTALESPWGNYSMWSAKSNAILGVPMSALDRIRLKQSGRLPHGVTTQFAPSAGRAMGSNCFSQKPKQDSETVQFIAQPVIATPVTTPIIAAPSLPIEPRAQQPSNENFLASSKVAIGRTPYNSEWNRVSRPSLLRGHVSALLGGRSGADFVALLEVNSWVNQSITHSEDRVLWNDSDYWATASETLARGRGDCEDFAILKYQMLIALGIDPRDMYLTLARDLVRRSDHAVLVVRLDGEHHMLDNSTDLVLPAGQAYDYRPTLSFNSETAWIHGYVDHTNRQQFAHLSVSETSTARVTGLSK